jgi:hypothetical protein
MTTQARQILVVEAEGKTRAISVLILSSSSREQDVREVMQWGPSATW